MWRTIAIPIIFASAVFGAPAASGPVANTKAGDWAPIPPEELAYRGSADMQGAHAIILYREQHTDDAARLETHHYRIKIMSEDGGKYADIEIPHAKGYFKVDEIRARTVRPDGADVPFAGEVFDKLVVKAKGMKVQTKTFTLPDVHPGVIIEYRYRTTWARTASTPRNGCCRGTCSPGAHAFHFAPLQA